MTVEEVGGGITIWMFPKIGVPQNGWFVMENLIKMDDLGVPLFLETSIYPGDPCDWHMKIYMWLLTFIRFSCR